MTHVASRRSLHSRPTTRPTRDVSPAHSVLTASFATMGVTGSNPVSSTICPGQRLSHGCLDQGFAGGFLDLGHSFGFQIVASWCRWSLSMLWMVQMSRTG